MNRTLLIVEDNADDAFFIRRAFVDSECKPFVCRNTSEARAYVLGAGIYANRKEFPAPEAVISDLRLGAESGLQFLKWFRSQKSFDKIPFILLSSMATSDELDLATQLGATESLLKPADSIAFHELLIKLLRNVCAIRPT